MSEKIITSVKELRELPESSAILTRTGDVRIKTCDGDDWSFIMDSQEVLEESNGKVTLIQGEERIITTEEELFSLPRSTVVITRNGIVRFKTDDSDDWNFVMNNKDILEEANGEVTFIG